MITPIHMSFLGGSPGGGEILLVLVVLLLFFGAKRLPGIARTLGKTLEEFRRAAREVTDEVMHADKKTPVPPSDAPRKELPEDKSDGDHV